jgi:hypothetical protein
MQVDPVAYFHKKRNKEETRNKKQETRKKETRNKKETKKLETKKQERNKKQYIFEAELGNTGINESKRRLKVSRQRNWGHRREERVYNSGVRQFRSSGWSHQHMIALHPQHPLANNVAWRLSTFGNNHIACSEDKTRFGFN